LILAHLGDFGKRNKFILRVHEYKTLLAIAAFIALLGSVGATSVTWDRRQQENHTLYLPFVQTAQPLTDVTICGTVISGECPDHPVVELWFRWHDDAEASDIVAEVPVADDGRPYQRPRAGRGLDLHDRRQRSPHSVRWGLPPTTHRQAKTTNRSAYLITFLSYLSRILNMLIDL
jgi:hypothetical protein